MSFKLLQITNDKKHPFFGIEGRVVPAFKNLPIRPLDSLRVIQDALHKENCRGCGRCCTGRFLPGIPIKPDDRLFRIHLNNTNKFIGQHHYGREIFLFRRMGRCDFLDDSNACSCYEIKPSICDTYPFSLENIRINGVGKGITLGRACPSIATMLDAHIPAVFLSDIIFSVSGALEQPELYAEESRRSGFIQALNRLEERGEKYYISPLMGTSILNLVREHKEGRTPYDTLSDSPFLMYENEVCFLL